MCHDPGGIDWAAAIDGIDDAMDADLAVLDAGFGYGGGVGLEGKISGYSSADALR